MNVITIMEKILPKLENNLQIIISFLELNFLNFSIMGISNFNNFFSLVVLISPINKNIRKQIPPIIIIPLVKTIVTS